MGIELLDIAHHTSGIDDDRGSVGKKRVEAPVSLPGLAPAEVAGHSLVLHVADVSDPGMGKMRPETHHRWQHDLGIKVAHGPAEAPRRAIIALDFNLAIRGGYGIAQVVPGNWRPHRWLHASQREEATLGGYGKGEGALAGGIVRHEDGPSGVRQHGIDASDAETQEVEAARPLNKACREKCDPGPGWLRHRGTTLMGTKLRSCIVL